MTCAKTGSTEFVCSTDNIPGTFTSGRHDLSAMGFRRPFKSPFHRAFATQLGRSTVYGTLIEQVISPS